jgi:hypothetical protein
LKIRKNENDTWYFANILFFNAVTAAAVSAGSFVVKGKKTAIIILKGAID